ncbi:MAG: alpha/beta hydrolase [Pseudomonadota bacterium]|nr:alpha/beta hydrolase [Pseudomonadota bacterium]
MNKRIIMLVASLACLAAGASYAQDYLRYPSVTMPDEDRGTPGVDYRQMYKTANIKTELAREHLPHVLDLKYGEDPKQRLDIYTPAKKPSGAPVFLFIHGGGGEEGDRAHYGYIAAPLASHGIVTAFPSYRLVGTEPGNKINYAEQEADIKAAIVWLYRNVARYGGDPNRIYVGGHSFGGQLAANLGVDRKWLSSAGIPTSIIPGIAAISGGFHRPPSEGPGAPGEFPTPSTWQSPVSHIADAAPYFVLAGGQKEIEMTGSFLSTADIEHFKSALESHGVHAVTAVQPAADHAEAVLALADEHSPQTQAILRMIAAPR